jgi:uncharacterized protein
MKIVCVEEHTVDLEMQSAALPLLRTEAPYLAAISLEESEPRSPHRAARVAMKEAVGLGLDLGEGRIKEMDAAGIQMQIVSSGTPAQFVPKEQAVAMTRALNNRLAAASAKNPSRLGGFAVLPWQDPQAAADELTRAVSELGLKGALILGRPGSAFLDHPQYLPVLQRFHALRVPLYLHPYVPVPQVQKIYYDDLLTPEVSARLSIAGWGWHNEAGVHLLRLLLSGVFERLPDLQIICGHWGEMVPFFLERLDSSISKKTTGFSRTIPEIYKDHVWVTPSGLFSLPHFQFIQSVVGVDRILWSTDYPYFRMDSAREFLLNLPVSEADKEKIAFRNAERLFRIKV